jgi:hypothetical protein
VLVGGKGLDHRAGMALRLLGDGLGKAFLERFPADVNRGRFP